MDLRVEGLRHVYSGRGLEARPVLAIEQWGLAAGEQALLRGISGSGKTTLFNILAGLLRPTAGQVWLGKQSLYALPEAARDEFRAGRIGYIFQSHLLVPNLTALENVVMPMAFAGKWMIAERRQRAADLLGQVGLAEFARHRPAQLSAGQRLRVAVVRALANAPQLVLADEPTAALDPASASQVMDLLQDACRQHGAILLVASHDPALNGRFERIFDLRDGQL